MKYGLIDFENQEAKMIAALDSSTKYIQYKRVNRGEDKERIAYELRVQKRTKELEKANKELRKIFTKEVPLNEDFELANLYNEQRRRTYGESAKLFLQYCYDNKLLDIHSYMLKPPKTDDIHINNKLSRESRLFKIKEYAREDDITIQNLINVIRFLENKMCYLKRWKVMDKVNTKSSIHIYSARAYTPDLKLYIQPITQCIATLIASLSQGENVCIVSDYSDKNGRIKVYVIHCNENISSMYKLYAEKLSF